MDAWMDVFEQLVVVLLLIFVDALFQIWASVETNFS